MPTTEYAPYRGTHKCVDIDNAIDRSIANATAIQGKQDALSVAQLAAVNSGIDSTKVGQIATNTSNITSQGTEITNAHTGADGTSYQSLSARLDAENAIYEKVQKNVLNGCDLNTLTGNNVYFLSSSYEYTNAPLEYGILFTYEMTGNWKMQLMYSISGHGVYKRVRNSSSVWSDWTQIDSIPQNSLGTSVNDTLSQNFITLNASGFARSAEEFATTSGSSTSISLANINKPGYYIISTTWTVTDAPSDIVVTGVKVEKYATGDSSKFLKQTIEGVGSTSYYHEYYRYSNNSGQWLDWKPCGRKGYMFSETALLPSCDLNDLTTDSTWLMADSQTYTNAPYYDSQGKTVGVLTQFAVTNGWKLQIWYSFSGADTYKRIGKAGNWSRPWAKINSGSGGGDVTYNITQNINRDEITNTYNITTSPTITTDSNGWLQAVDTNTSSESGKTDMSGAILSMLTDTGYCHLAPGIFYVSGFDMPAGSTLEGCGKATIIRLLQSVNSGYTARIGQNCTIKNICFSGGYSAPADLTTPDTTLGSRHGIYVVANADGEEASAPACLTNLVEGCFFENYNGSAFYNHNTGYGMDNVVIMTDCRIVSCKVGLNIDYFGEYAKYSNIIIYNCNIACINNGGNNVFTACTFHGVKGFVIDNSNDDKLNNSHGSCVGCTFNHIDNANHPTEHGMGDAITVKNAGNGFVFSECQLWYGAVKIENSKGIMIQNSLIGGGTPSISVIGSYPAFIQNCIFMATPSLNVTVDTIIQGCYLAANGTPVLNQ